MWKRNDKKVCPDVLILTQKSMNGSGPAPRPIPQCGGWSRCSSSFYSSFSSSAVCSAVERKQIELLYPPSSTPTSQESNTARNSRSSNGLNHSPAPTSIEKWRKGAGDQHLNSMDQHGDDANYTKSLKLLLKSWAKFSLIFSDHESTITSTVNLTCHHSSMN